MNTAMADYGMIKLPLSSPVDRLPPIGFERSLSNPSPTFSIGSISSLNLNPAGLFAPTTPRDRCRIRRAKFYDRMEFACVLKQVVSRGVIRIVASDEWKFPIWNGNLDETAVLPAPVVPSVAPREGFSNAAGTAWHSADSCYQINSKEGLNNISASKCAFRMFVGGMPSSMTARQLATVLNDIFGFVDCVRIQFNPGNSNPSRCATVDFRNVASAFAAVYYQRIIVRTPDYCKALNIYPFIKNSAWCSLCGQVTYEPILCREVICMTKYMCLNCWKKSHRQQTLGRADHEPLMRHPTEEVKNIQMWFRFPPSLLEMIKNSVEFPEYLVPGVMYDFSKPIALHDPIVTEIVTQIDGHDVLCHACHVSPPGTPSPTASSSVGSNGLGGSILGSSAENGNGILNNDYYEGILNASNALLQLINGER